MTTITLFLCGDVMTGRGIDQILARPSVPALHEGYIESALGYVLIAERRNGAIPRRVEPGYIWGDALEELRRAAPQVRVVNLETAVTTSEDWADKGINYRMHPANVTCLNAAGIDCCALANNHMLDWGHAGLEETLRTLQAAHIRTAGAGADLRVAQAPAEVPLVQGRRLLVFSCCTKSSGVPSDWAATVRKPGINFIEELSVHSFVGVANGIRSCTRPGDLVIASIHWGPNWGYAISDAERTFAKRLLDEAGVHLVHGHSSHHARGIEVHNGKLILYGCGDLINDYEGIAGHEAFRGDLGLMYFPMLDAETGRLVELEMVPTRLRRFRVERTPVADADWLVSMLNLEGRDLGTWAELQTDGRIRLRWF